MCRFCYAIFWGRLMKQTNTCSFHVLAQELWHVIATWCKILSIYAFSIHDVVDQYKYSKFTKRKAEASYAITLIAIWALWKARNVLVLEEKPAQVVDLVERIIVLEFLWIRSRSRSISVSWEDWKSFNQ
ncbi:uncharacterized protein LOC143620663 [Bidens hawaiensis]|uniref:uncharacterized protein LOC143620663 n=1 Tax=Bidens hawaiensis TaxID=980011 RepID=UPI00404A20F8